MTEFETPFEAEIASACKAGKLCPQPLAHGSPCGRAIDPSHDLGLCQWHSEDLLGLPHHGDDDPFEKVNGQKVCTRCQKRPVAYRVTRLCGNCQKVTKRQHIVESGKRRSAAIAGRHG